MVTKEKGTKQGILRERREPEGPRRSPNDNGLVEGSQATDSIVAVTTALHSPSRQTACG